MRWANLANRLVQVGLSLSLAVGLNYLAARHFARWDLTDSHRFSLGAETRAYLAQIPRNNPPVKLILTYQPQPGTEEQTEAIMKQLRALLREYKYAADGLKVPLETEEVDIYKQGRRTDELNKLYQLSPRPGSLSRTETTTANWPWPTCSRSKTAASFPASWASAP